MYVCIHHMQIVKSSVGKPNEKNKHPQKQTSNHNTTYLCVCAFVTRTLNGLELASLHLSLLSYYHELNCS